MPRIVMLIEVQENNIESFFGEFEKMVEADFIDGFFSLCQDGESLSGELPNYMDHERLVADSVASMEKDFILLNDQSSEKTGEEYLSLSHIEEKRQAWHDHNYGPDIDDMTPENDFEYDGDNDE